MSHSMCTTRSPQNGHIESLYSNIRRWGEQVVLGRLPKTLSLVPQYVSFPKDDCTSWLHSEHTQNLLCSKEPVPTPLLQIFFIVNTWKQRIQEVCFYISLYLHNTGTDTHLHHHFLNSQLPEQQAPGEHGCPSLSDTPKTGTMSTTGLRWLEGFQVTSLSTIGKAIKGPQNKKLFGGPKQTSPEPAAPKWDSSCKESWQGKYLKSEKEGDFFSFFLSLCEQTNLRCK